MGHLQRTQHIYKCDKPGCLEEVTVYDHEYPKGWARGNLTLTNKKGHVKTDNYWHSCSNDHAYAAFSVILDRAIKEEVK